MKKRTINQTNQTKITYDNNYMKHKIRNVIKKQGGISYLPEGDKQSGVKTK